MNQIKLIDFSDTSKQAFIRGFWKGLSAPVVLFGRVEHPKRREIKLISLPSKTVADALAEDWQAIGTDFHNVIEKHGRGGPKALNRYLRN